MAVVLAFYKGRRAENPHARPFDRLVCWWPRSRGRFSHAELVIGREGGMWFCWSSSARDGGVRSKAIDLASGRWVLVQLQHLEAAPAFTWFGLHEGWRYDYPGILGYVVPLVKQVRRWLYCSEAVAKSLKAAALTEWPGALRHWPRSDISPSALFAWCIEQPGARLVDLSQLEKAHA